MRRLAPAVLIGLLATLGFGLVHTVAAQIPLANGQVIWPAWDPRWPMLPLMGPLPVRPIEHIRGAYAFAMTRADVLQYIPCYCHCEQAGHRSNVDCYIHAKAADGTPQWDNHGVT